MVLKINLEKKRDLQRFLKVFLPSFNPPKNRTSALKINLNRAFKNSPFRFCALFSPPKWTFAPQMWSFRLIIVPLFHFFFSCQSVTIISIKCFISFFSTLSYFRNSLHQHNQIVFFFKKKKAFVGILADDFSWLFSLWTSVLGLPFCFTAYATCS